MLYYIGCKFIRSENASPSNGKTCLKYARSSCTHPSHNMRPHSTGRKPAPVPLRPLIILHNLTWDWIRGPAMGSQWLTSWAMTQPNEQVGMWKEIGVVWLKVLPRHLPGGAEHNHEFLSQESSFLNCTPEHNQYEAGVGVRDVWTNHGRNLRTGGLCAPRIQSQHHNTRNWKHKTEWHCRLSHNGGYVCDALLSGRNSSKFRTYCLFVWLVLKPWSWRQYVPPLMNFYWTTRCPRRQYCFYKIQLVNRRFS
jgi:hypothetical protein